jgi:hypothetical protein
MGALTRINAMDASSVDEDYNKVISDITFVSKSLTNIFTWLDEKNLTYYGPTDLEYHANRLITVCDAVLGSFNKDKNDNYFSKLVFQMHTTIDGKIPIEKLQSLRSCLFELNDKTNPTVRHASLANQLNSLQKSDYLSKCVEATNNARLANA